MSTKHMRSSGSWEYVVRRKGVLPKPLSFTFESDVEGDAYVGRLEQMLDAGIVPDELLARRDECVTIDEAIRAYLKSHSLVGTGLASRRQREPCQRRPRRTTPATDPTFPIRGHRDALDIKIVQGVFACAASAHRSKQEGVMACPNKRVLATVLGGAAIACLALLDTRLAEYANEVRRLTPGFDCLSPGQKIAVVDHAYNIGITSYKSSRLRWMHVDGNFPAACDEYLRWKFIHGGRTDCSLRTTHCSGIYARRLAARAACRGSDGKDAGGACRIARGAVAKERQDSTERGR